PKAVDEPEGEEPKAVDEPEGEEATLGTAGGGAGAEATRGGSAGAGGSSALRPDSRPSLGTVFGSRSERACESASGTGADRVLEMVRSSSPFESAPRLNVSGSTLSGPAALIGVP